MTDRNPLSAKQTYKARENARVRREIAARIDSYADDVARYGLIVSLEWLRSFARKLVDEADATELEMSRMGTTGE